VFFGFWFVVVFGFGWVFFFFFFFGVGRVCFFFLGSISNYKQTSLSLDSIHGWIGSPVDCLFHHSSTRCPPRRQLIFFCPRFARSCDDSSIFFCLQSRVDFALPFPASFSHNLSLCSAFSIGGGWIC